MAHKFSSGNSLSFGGYDAPGFGPLDAIDDCSIGVQGDPGTVTVTFSTERGKTLLIIDPEFADILSGWLQAMAEKAKNPEPHLSLVEAK